VDEHGNTQPRRRTFFALFPFHFPSKQGSLLINLGLIWSPLIPGSMIHRSYFNIDEQEATEVELREVALTAISILVFVITVLVSLTIYFIT